MKKEKPNLIKKGKLNNSYLKYSGLAFQIIAALLLGVFLGKKIDTYIDNEKSIFTGLLPILFYFAIFYKLVKELNSNK